MNVDAQPFSYTWDLHESLGIKNNEKRMETRGMLDSPIHLNRKFRFRVGYEFLTQFFKNRPKKNSKKGVKIAIFLQK